MSAELEVHMLRRGEIEEFAITSEPVKVRGVYAGWCWMQGETGEAFCAG